MIQTWQLQEAKNKLSQVVDNAVNSGPQIITRRGVEVVIVISYAEYQRMVASRGSLSDFFARSPLAGIELDLRGERVEGALQRLDGYLDAALRENAPWVRIIHGKGTGRLRTAVRQMLKEHPRVSRYEDGKDGEGGWGVTVAHLDSD